MLDKVKAAAKEISAHSAATEEEIENFRLRFISKKSIVNELFEDF